LAVGLSDGRHEGLDLEYGHNKPIEFMRPLVPVWYTGDAIADSPVEAWEFIVGAEEVSIT
jgi:hypothetical protein